MAVTADEFLAKRGLLLVAALGRFAERQDANIDRMREEGIPQMVELFIRQRDEALATVAELGDLLAGEENPVARGVPLEDIRAVVSYCWADECRDFEENPGPGHVFVSLGRVREWLDSGGV